MSERQPHAGTRLPYLPGLDGLRALAVIAVLLYHADLTWIPGGFLGVEVFFVISGYLITSLLLAEWRDTGRIDLGQFWLRRARRLLPALFLVLAVTIAFSALFLRGELQGLRGDVLAALTYSTNWYLSFSGQSYFEAFGRPPLLQHLWSLAVEEQFYLLWPLLFTLGMTRLGRRRVFRLVLVGVAASTLLMAVLYSPDRDPSRVYYGLDTRAAGLLIGVALAFLWSPWRLKKPAGRAAPAVLDAIGLASLAGLVASLFLIGETSTFLYRGGFLVVSLLTAALIAVAVHPASRLTVTVLGVAFLRWVGVRSYGIYLWHWPIYQITRPELDVPISGVPLLVFRLALTAIVAELSFRYVEIPVRQGALGRRLAAIRLARGLGRTRLVARTAWATTGAVAVVGLLGLALVRAPEPGLPDFLNAGANGPGLDRGNADKPVDVLASATTTTVAAVPPTTTVPTSAPAAGPAGDPAATPTGPAPTAPPATTPPPPPAPATVAVGDSVMLGAATALGQAFGGNIIVDAVVGRQASDGVAVLRARRDAGQLTGTVVVQLGNNGTFNDAQFDEMMQVLQGVPKVVVLNVRVTRGWESQVNQTVAAGASRYPNVVFLDWYNASAGRYDLFWDDDIHLRPEGAAYYAQLIRQYVG
ncbi:MAG: acyltransferase [Acidimicrobiales bacterium]|nr:acyltransferase [Acidimicrobiales bacterium]